MSAPPEESTITSRDLAFAQLAVASGFHPLNVEYNPIENRCTFVWRSSPELYKLRDAFLSHSAVVQFHEAYDAQRTVRSLINAARARSLSA